MKKNIDSLITCDLQKRGLGSASAFGGTGNNTNAASGSLNGNNSVANSNTNYAPVFALRYQENDSQEKQIDPSSAVSKTEKIATTVHIEKGTVPVSSTTPESGVGNSDLDWQDFGNPFYDDDESRDLTTACAGYPDQRRKENFFKEGLKTMSRHSRLHNLKAFLCNREMIRYAIITAAENKSPTRELVYIMHHIPQTVERIRNELLTETYVPRPYRFRTIVNDRGKKRHLAVLGFYDRCVQALFKLVIQSKLRLLEPRNVYSNLPKRGTLSNTSEFCLYGQLRHSAKVYKDGFYLKMDANKCYESVPVSLLMRRLSRYIKDPFALRLAKRMLMHIKCLPIGDPLSGLYINLVMLEWHRYALDHLHHLFDECYFFCDDMLFINRDSKEELHQLCKIARQWFPEHYGLYIKDNYKLSRVSEGIRFCGIHAYADGRGYIKRQVKKRMLKTRRNPRSLASYKGILEKTSSDHLARVLDIPKLHEKMTMKKSA